MSCWRRFALRHCPKNIAVCEIDRCVILEEMVMRAAVVADQCGIPSKARLV